MKDIFLIAQPHITEKATALATEGKYVFVVKPGSTKNEVKKAVKELYRVDATTVQMITLPGKTKRYRGTKSPRAGLKKAIVTLKAGQTIDLGR